MDAELIIFQVVVIALEWREVLLGREVAALQKRLVGVHGRGSRGGLDAKRAVEVQVGGGGGAVGAGWANALLLKGPLLEVGGKRCSDVNHGCEVDSTMAARRQDGMAGVQGNGQQMHTDGEDAKATDKKKNRAAGKERCRRRGRLRRGWRVG